MSAENKIDIDVFKVVTRAIAESTEPGIMASHLSQLLVGALDIRGCTVFVLNPETKELEVLASAGLSEEFLSKGPVVFDKSIGCIEDENSITIGDISNSDRLQYPKETLAEGIKAIVSVPIVFSGDTQGALRLYHYDVWHISDRDLDSLLLLAENIGLGMAYTKLSNMMQAIKETMEGGC